jgi:hypothetical protein
LLVKLFAGDEGLWRLVELRTKLPQSHAQARSLMRSTAEDSLNSLLIALSDPKRNSCEYEK